MTDEERCYYVEILKQMKFRCEEKGYSGEVEALDVAIELMEEARWIPVTERLPEKDGFYLATSDGEICGNDAPFSWLAEFENGKWVADEDDYQCVLAWMPLPQPYAESEDETPRNNLAEFSQESDAEDKYDIGNCGYTDAMCDIANREG